MRGDRLLFSLAVLGAVVAVGCAGPQGSPTAPDLSDGSFTVDTEDNDGKGKPDVELCHATGTDRWVRIEVGAPAEDDHRAHGDAAPGEPVPGDPGFVFDESCSRVPAPAGGTCPCWADRPVDDLVVIFPDFGVTATDNGIIVSVTSESLSIFLITNSQDSSCLFFDLNDPSTSFSPVTGIDEADFQACVADVRAVQDALGL